MDEFVRGCYIMKLKRGHDMKVKYIPNIITITRIIGSIYIIVLKPISTMFFIIYSLCAISDILDGYIARKTNTCTKFGEYLDSFADAIFFIIILVKFLLLERLENYIIYWFIAICSIKAVSLIVGFIKYKTVAFLHTYANKFMGGVILICFPMMYLLGGVTKTLVFLCIFASISSVEELQINLTSKKLNRNVRSIFKE